MTDDVQVEDRPDEDRFFVTVDGHEAELVYQLRGDRFALVHTGVPSELEGRGIGSALVRAAVERAVAEDLTIVPACPFVGRWLDRHPDSPVKVAGRV